MSPSLSSLTQAYAPHPLTSTCLSPAVILQYPLRQFFPHWALSIIFTTHRQNFPCAWKTERRGRQWHFCADWLHVKLLAANVSHRALRVRSRCFLHRFVFSFAEMAFSWRILFPKISCSSHSCLNSLLMILLSPLLKQNKQTKKDVKAIFPPFSVPNIHMCTHLSLPSYYQPVLLLDQPFQYLNI